MISSSGTRPTAAVSPSRPLSPSAAQAQAATSAPPATAQRPAVWRAPDEGVLCIHRLSFALHTWPDLSRLEAPDLLRFDPHAFAAPVRGSLQPRAVAVLPVQPFESFLRLVEAEAAAIQAAPVRRALLSEPATEPAPERPSTPPRLPRASRQRRRAVLSSAAAAAEATCRTDAGPDASAHPGTLAAALLPRSLKRPLPTPDRSPAPDFDWASATESARASEFFAMACRFATRADFQVWNDFLPPGLSTAAFTTRFAQFHQAAVNLPLEEMGRLMFVFVSRWHDRLAEPWSPMEWGALNGEALRRDEAVAPRLHACFVATYLFARGSQAEDRSAGGKRVSQELTHALGLNSPVSKSDEMASNLHRSMALAVAHLGHEEGTERTFRLRAALLRCFLGCSVSQGVAHLQARDVRRAGHASAPPPGASVSGAAPARPAK